MVESTTELHAVRRGGGPPLVLIHGGVGSSNHWARNIDALAEQFEVFAVDLPGFGNSSIADEKMPADAYVDLCTRSIDALLPKGPAYLLGFSFGGVIGAYVGAALGGRFAKVSLISPGGLLAIREGKPAYRKMPPEDAPEAEIRETVRYNLLQLMLHHPASVSDETIDMQLANIANTRFHSRSVSRYDCLLDEIRRIDAPLQIVLGEHDTVLYPSHERRIAHIRTARPDVRINMIPGAGHWMQYEQADAVNQVLIDFFMADTG